MASYLAQDSLVQDRQLKVLEINIPFAITANATPASKTVVSDEPARLFLNTEGITGISVANGALTTAELAAITFATATDSTGIGNLLVQFNEQIQKVISIELVRRNGSEFITGTFPTGATTGITLLGDKVVANFDSAVNFATTDYTANVCVKVAVPV